MTGHSLNTMVEDQAPTLPTLEVAERLGIDVMDVYRMIDEGRLSVAWDGGRLVVPLAQVESLPISPR